LRLAKAGWDAEAGSGEHDKGVYLHTRLNRAQRAALSRVAAEREGKEQGQAATNLCAHHAEINEKLEYAALLVAVGFATLAALVLIHLQAALLF